MCQSENDKIKENKQTNANIQIQTSGSTEMSTPFQFIAKQNKQKTLFSPFRKAIPYQKVESKQEMSTISNSYAKCEQRRSQVAHVS